MKENKSLVFKNYCQAEGSGHTLQINQVSVKYLIQPKIETTIKLN